MSNKTRMMFYKLCLHERASLASRYKDLLAFATSHIHKGLQSYSSKRLFITYWLININFECISMADAANFTLHILEKLFVFQILRIRSGSRPHAFKIKKFIIITYLFKTVESSEGFGLSEWQEGFECVHA